VHRRGRLMADDVRPDDRGQPAKLGIPWRIHSGPVSGTRIISVSSARCSRRCIEPSGEVPADSSQPGDDWQRSGFSRETHRPRAAATVTA